MKIAFLLLFVELVTCAQGQVARNGRRQAELYLVAYARHYGIPVAFARAVVEQESGWNNCAVSSKGAVGLMQLMPETAQRLGVQNRCDPRQNISGGIRYLAWLSRRFHGDLRLVAAAYYVGEKTIDRHGLDYSNRDVVAYVSSIRQRVERQRPTNSHPSEALRRTR
jgi:soluble lytic murein transglycosylase-like protein